MRFISLKLLFASVLLPPILYIATMEGVQKLYLDRYLTVKYKSEIENIYIGDAEPLLKGKLRLKNTIEKNIFRFLQDKNYLKFLGIKVRIAIITKKGHVLYPKLIETKKEYMESDNIRIASENLKLMDEGINIKLRLKLEYGSLLSFIILGAYIFLAMIAVYCHYKRVRARAKREESLKDTEIERLLSAEKERLNKLDLLEKDRLRLKEKFKKTKEILKKEKDKALKNEDGMIEEIERLEKEIEENISLREKQREEIENLRKKIEDLEKTRAKTDKQSKKDSNIVKKRFRTLYKNLSFHDRAIKGFLSLTDDLKIKGEEVIHQLNDNPELVPVKRKVFGKKGTITVFEVVFAYKGRLYYHKKEGAQLEILSIGTKNTQAKDLGFLHNY